MENNRFQAVYEATKVGSQGTVTESDRAKLAVFQSELADAERAQRNGLVEIVYWHRENSTGERYIDLFRVRRDG
jgi:hypothetical protein